jgi:hypothetical protein
MKKSNVGPERFDSNILFRAMFAIPNRSRPSTFSRSSPRTAEPAKKLKNSLLLISY